MRTIPSLLLVVALPASLSAQNRPPEIEEKVLKTNRHAIYDLDQSGWCSLWRSLFPEIDITQPDRDENGDGKTNYQAMLDFENPYLGSTPARELTPEEARQARIALERTRDASDVAKLARFQSILDARHSQPGPPLLKGGQGEGMHGGGFQTMALQAPAGPHILAFERLSTGHNMIAWEGAADRLFHIEYSDDLENWSTAAINIPTIGGIGNGGFSTSLPKRFYRVFETSEEEGGIIPSDPSGGNGVTTFGGTATANLSSPTYVTFEITSNLPDFAEPTVALHIDGRFIQYCALQQHDGKFRAYVPKLNLSPGTHTFYAILDASADLPGSSGEPGASYRSVFRTPMSSFTLPALGQSGGSPAYFHVEEEEIAPDDPKLPDTTVFHARFAQETMWVVKLRNEDGNIVRQWNSDGFSYSFSIPWNGTNENGSLVPGGLYSAEVTINAGGGDLQFGEVMTVAAGQRLWRVLGVMEPMLGLPAAAGPAQNQWLANYRPEWRGALSSSGHSNAFSAWGPWGSLGSVHNIVDELKPARDGLPGGKWTVHQWEANPKNSTPAAGNPPAVFSAGGNPFNAYDMGLIVGHGVASSGGVYAGSAGPSLLPPQHYMPIVTNRATGATTWVGSAQHEKYGAAGSKLKWMFLFTCNGLRDTNPHAIYTAMKSAGTLPFGPDLHILCGYETSIDLETGMGKQLAEALKHGPPTGGDNTVANAWDAVWRNSSNCKELKATGKDSDIRTARVVYWPECENDTIYGVPNENVTEPTGPYNQGRLEHFDINQHTSPPQ